MADQVIYKYPIIVGHTVAVELPKGAQILSVRSNTTGSIDLWAIIDRYVIESEIRHIRIFGTGHPYTLGDHGVFIGTVFDDEARLVWHVFEDTAP